MNNMIPFVDLSPIHQPLQRKFQAVLDECISSSNFVLGEKVLQFENNFASYCETPFCIGVSSGTDALFLTLKGLEICEGDEVIVPAHTFIATAMAVSHCGAIPIFADVNPENWNITWDNISPLITPKTKAIIIVHLYGNPVDINSIITEAQKRSIPVIEDAAQAHGALYHTKRIGSLADAACFSFYPSKNLGSLGEGGAITTKNRELAEKIKQLRDYGRSDKYQHDFIGYNMRLQALQAGFLSIKLPFLDKWNEERTYLVSIYQEALKNTSLTFQEVYPNSSSVYHLCVVKSEQRVPLIHALETNRIGFGIHYPIPCHKQVAYQSQNPISLPVSEELSRQVISLPLYVGLKEQQIREVCEVLKRTVKS